MQGLTKFFRATTTIGTVSNKNTTTTHVMTLSMEPQHHLAYVFSSADRPRGRGGSLSLSVVGSTQQSLSLLRPVRSLMGMCLEWLAYRGCLPAMVVSYEIDSVIEEWKH